MPPSPFEYSSRVPTRGLPIQHVAGTRRGRAPQLGAEPPRRALSLSTVTAWRHARHRRPAARCVRRWASSDRNGYNVEGRPRRGSLVAARTTRPPTYPRRENERAPSWFNSAQGVSQESWRSFVQKRLKTATSSRRGRSSRSKSTVVSTVAGISFSTPRADLLAEMICDFQLGGFLPPLIFVRSGRDDSLHFIVIITIKYDL
jgi:hypothetical protein